MAAKGSMTIVLIAMGANFAIACCKFVAYLWTASSAMLSEAVHSLVDTSNQALLLFGIKRSQRQADALHPFGYSKELYFWSFIVAILLFSLGAGVAIYEGIEKLAHPHPIENAYINYAVLLTAMAIEGYSTWMALREFNRRRGEAGFVAALKSSKDPALFAIVLEDLAAMVGLFCALAGVLIADQLALPAADGAASLAIGMVLAGVALFMSIEIRGLIVGEAATPAVQSGLRRMIEAETGPGKAIRSINEIRTMHLGPEDVLVAASVDVHDSQTAKVIKATTARLERSVRTRFPEVRRLFLEVQSEDEHARLARPHSLKRRKGSEDATSAEISPDAPAPAASGNANSASKAAGTAAGSTGKPSRKQRKAARKSRKQRP